MQNTIVTRPSLAVAFAALLAVPVLAQNSPPEVIAGTNGEGEVVFKDNNCVVYYNAAGIRTRSLPSCTSSQKAQAARAMSGYRREQGVGQPVANHSPPSSHSPVYSDNYSPPEVIMGRNGQGEVIFRGNNCVVYYNAAGIRTRSLPSCTTAQRTQAAVAMSSYRREQGVNRPVANHSPIYRDFSSNRINLICHGDGTRLTYSNNMGYRWDEDRQRYLPQSIPGYEREQYDAYLTIQLDGNRGRIRLPKSMVPAIHSDDNHGWRELKDLRYTRSSIKGSYKLNTLNKPNITINRRTGRINISGRSGFNGNCVALDRGSLRWR